MLICAPWHVLEGWMGEFVVVRLVPSQAVEPTFMDYARFYAERIAIQILGHVYNFLVPALVLALLGAGASLGVHLLFRRYRGSYAKRLAVEAIAYVATMIPIALLLRAPGAVSLVLLIAAVHVLNFSLPRFEGGVLERGPQRSAIRAIIWLGSLVGISHLLAPVGLLKFAAWCLLPRSPRIQWIACQLGRLFACLVSLPVLVLVAYSLQRIPLSPQASPVLEQPGLYDIIIDRPGNRLFATTKAGGSAVVLTLDNLKPFGTLVLPTPELEDVEFDPESRKIFHVNRNTGDILVVDADTFAISRLGRIAVPSNSGSTMLALDKSSGILLVHWEDNNLFAVDCSTGEWNWLGSPGNVSLLADQANGLVYMSSENRPVVAAIDPEGMQETCYATGPSKGERMALSERRGELYCPDPTTGQIWVYSTPGLRILRKMPAQFGVRALAVDEENELLLAASFVTGYVEIIDLKAGQRLERHYVGDSCRIVAVDAPTRRAFITLRNDGLFLLDY